MATSGITPTDGINEILNSYLAQNLDLILISDTSLPADPSYSDLTELTSAGSYIKKTITGGSWTVTNKNATNSDQDFTASGASFSPAVTGWALLTQDATPILVHLVTYAKINHGSVTGGPFVVGETVTAGGGGTGVVRKVDGGGTYVEVDYPTGTLTGTLTGGTSGATASISSTTGVTVADGQTFRCKLSSTGS